MSRKAQVWSLDFSASVVIFFIVVATLLFAWAYASSSSRQSATFNELESLSLSITEGLIRTPGYPEDWTSSNVEVIGLADEEGIVNQSKVEEFLNMDYGKAKALLSVYDYDFYFRLKYLNESTIQTVTGSAEFGQYPTNANIVVPVQRFVLYNGIDVSKMDFVLWQ